MPEPITLGALLLGAVAALRPILDRVASNSVVTGVAGNITDRVLVQMLQGTKDRIAGLQKSPSNLDVARALRTAQLQALERLIRDYEALNPESKRQPLSLRARFIKAGLAFCSGDIGRNPLRPNVRVNVSLTPTLEAAMNSVFAPPASDGAANARFQLAARLAEDAVLKELLEATTVASPPEDFVQHFYAGDGTKPRFLEHFATFLGEQLKEKARFFAMFTAGELIDLKALALGNREIITRVETHFGVQLHRIEEVLAETAKTVAITETKTDEILRRVREMNPVPLSTLRSILALMGAAGVAEDRIEEVLRKKAAEYIALQERLAKMSATNPDTRAAHIEVAACLERGDLDHAGVLLDEAYVRECEAGQARLIAAATFRANHASVDRLRLRYREAAKKFCEAAALVHFSPDEAAGYLEDQAESLMTHGEEFGDNEALREAIDVWRTVIRCWVREQVPLRWAAAHNSLGVALRVLGEREADIVRLQDAVATFNCALEERTRDRVPSDWAATRINLGVVLMVLGERQSDLSTMQAAVAMFSSALEEQTRERNATEWARAQHNLGAALATLGARESGSATLVAAVVAYRAALEEWARERVPLRWAGTQNNLGNALMRLAERETGTGRLKEAIAAYNAALTEWTRQRVPLDWALAQGNLANALLSLGEREPGNTHLVEAIVAYREALQEQKRERVPLDWARTQTNLGNALLILGARESGNTHIEAALAAYQSALEERKRERVPLSWAMTLTNLGNALLLLGERENNTMRMQEAIAAYQAALEERTRDRVPLDWAKTQSRLGNALRALGAREPGTARLVTSVAAYGAALEEITRECLPLDWAATQFEFGLALYALGERETGTARLESAIAALQTAVDVYSVEGVEGELKAAEAELAIARRLYNQRCELS